MASIERRFDQIASKYVRTGFPLRFVVILETQ